MKDIKARKGYFYIHKLIDEGEHETQDFKFAISDARKIARSVSAFANNRGGCLLIGVKDNGSVAGVRNEEDIYVVEQAAQLYCQPPQDVEFEAYRVEDGLIVIKATVQAYPDKGVCVKEADGRLRAYYRVAEENIAAHPLMVRAWKISALGTASLGTVSLDGPIGRILTAVRQSPTPLATDRIAILTHISRETADELIATLVSMGLLEFVYDGHGFALTVPS